TRFVTGLDEALDEYRGLDDAMPRGNGETLDPWREDLFIHHLPSLPQDTTAPAAEPEASGPGPRAEAGEPRALLPSNGKAGCRLDWPFPPLERIAGIVSVAGSLVAVRGFQAPWTAITRQTRFPAGPLAGARRGRRTAKAPVREPDR